MSYVLNPDEIRGALAVGAKVSGRLELSDPWKWQDLTARADETVAVVRRRVESNATPHRGQVFRWPKERGGYRPMAWLDPIDQIAYRAAVGQLVGPIVAGVDSQVISGRLHQVPPAWELTYFGQLIGERRHRAKKLVWVDSCMGVIDIENFFPSVTRSALEDQLSGLAVPPDAVGWVLDWLDDLDDLSGINGLPTGHEPSQILATAVLAGGDALLSRLEVPFLRYVDDIWFFPQNEAHYDTIVGLYGTEVAKVGLKTHPDKTRFCDIFEALDEIERFAITYVEDLLKEPSPEGLAAGLELFSYALEEPAARKSEMRRALTCLARHRDPFPLDELRANRELLRFAPKHWVTYLRSMVAAKASRRLVDDDWLVEQIVATPTKDEGYANLLFLQAADPISLSRDHGRQIFDVTKSEGGWTAPIRVWAAKTWGKSAAYRPDEAVEQVEQRGDYDTRRAFALTLDQRRGHAKLPKWARRVRRASEELEPTAAWLEAA